LTDEESGYGGQGDTAAMVTVRVSGYGGARCYELTQRAHDCEAE
jgi:hypothetical protein